MEQDTRAPLVDSHAFPVGFVVMPAFVGALLWLITMLNHFTRL
jgi:hypothetical protein